MAGRLCPDDDYDCHLLAAFDNTALMPEIGIFDETFPAEHDCKRYMPTRRKYLDPIGPNLERLHVLMTYQPVPLDDCNNHQTAAAELTSSRCRSE